MTEPKPMPSAPPPRLPRPVSHGELVHLLQYAHRTQWALNSAVECHLHTVEVIGSNPIAPTIMPLRFGGIRSFPACGGQDFASGLGRPLSGSSSNPIAPTTLRFRISEFSVGTARVEIYKFLLARRHVRGNISLSSVCRPFRCGISRKD